MRSTRPLTFLLIVLSASTALTGLSAATSPSYASAITIDNVALQLSKCADWGCDQKITTTFSLDPNYCSGTPTKRHVWVQHFDADNKGSDDPLNSGICLALASYASNGCHVAIQLPIATQDVDKDEGDDQAEVYALIQVYDGDCTKSTKMLATHVTDELKVYADGLMCTSSSCKQECSSGACCDATTHKYQHAGIMCRVQAEGSELSCQPAGCAGTVVKRERFRYCTGKDSMCGTKNLKAGPWKAQTSCSLSGMCVVNASAGAANCIPSTSCKGQCKSGACCDIKTSAFVAKATICSSKPVSVESKCASTSCGAQVLSRKKLRRCTGSSSDCGLTDTAWSSWSLASKCSPSQRCKNSNGGVQCVTDAQCSPAQCVGGACCDLDKKTFLSKDAACSTKPGCAQTTSGGCNNCPCEKMVCGADPFCCKTKWDNLCVDACEKAGGCSGGGPSETRCIGSGCGGWIEKRVAKQRCTGKSATCGADNLLWDPWVKTLTCTMSQSCIKDEGKEAKCESATDCGAAKSCNSGYCCDKKKGIVKPSGTQCTKTPLETETACSDPGCGAQIRRRDRHKFCDGSSGTCSSKNAAWGSWVVLETCNEESLCDEGEGGPVCVSSEGCGGKSAADASAEIDISEQDAGTTEDAEAAETTEAINAAEASGYGCVGWKGSGCGGCACEAAVCEIDPFCCTGLWDHVCAARCAKKGPCGPGGALQDTTNPEDLPTPEDTVGGPPQTPPNNPPPPSSGCSAALRSPSPPPWPLVFALLLPIWGLWRRREQI